MKVRNKIKFSTLYLLISMCSLVSQAQYIKTVHSYLPAPGQYSNSEQIGRPAAGQSIVGKLNGLVSLGGFGGYIVVGFENSIENDPANPYGVDFTIFGNATSTWSEAGIVQVMRDDNGNKMPDDTWYEIAGSDHFFRSTKTKYQITYQNPGDGLVADISWSDNLGQLGTMKANSYHQQPYYPMSAYFPEVNTFQLTLSGTLLIGNIDLSSTTQVLVSHRAFGYADNTKILSLTENLPDNPYTDEIEGSGGDAIDISWARDANGKYVELDKIDFIRIYTGMNDIAGWLGEISTEIAGIRDVAPQQTSGANQMIVIEDLPKSILKDDDLSLNAHYFLKGKPIDETIEWIADKSDLLKIENGKLNAIKAGTVVLKAQLSSDHTVFAEHELKIFSAGHAVIALSDTNVQKNDKLKITGKITDDDGNSISGITGKWISGDTNIFTISEEDGQAYLIAKNEGQAWLYFQAENMPEIIDSVQITVLPESVAKKVFISLKTSENTIFPRQSLNVSLFNLNTFVDSRTGDYSVQTSSKITVAHVLAEVFKTLQAESSFKFRDDEKGNNQLYIWKVPETVDGSTAFYYGYGGSRETDAFKKTWLVKINQQSAVSGFDKLEVNNNDEILVYHITNNSASWLITQLTASNDSLQKSEAVEIQRVQFECNMNADRQVSISSSKVLEKTEVKVTGGETKLTDEFGKASFIFGQSGNYMVSSGIDQLKLHVAGTTGTQLPADNEMKIFPNPATDQIRIKTEFHSGRLELFDYSGQMVIQRELSDGNSVDISFLKSGMYIVRLVSGVKTVQQKFIKK